MNNSDTLPPAGRESRILVVLDRATDNANNVADMINTCIERRLKVKHVEVPKGEFEWTDPNGQKIEINNFFDNKAIFTFVPA